MPRHIHPSWLLCTSDSPRHPYYTCTSTVFPLTPFRRRRHRQLRRYRRPHDPLGRFQRRGHRRGLHFPGRSFHLRPLDLWRGFCLRVGFPFRLRWSLGLSQRVRLGKQGQQWVGSCFVSCGWEGGGDRDGDGDGWCARARRGSGYWRGDGALGGLPTAAHPEHSRYQGQSSRRITVRTTRLVAFYPTASPLTS